MVRVFTLLCLTAFLISSTAFAGLIPIGFVSWDVTSSTTGQFDITNQTGLNSTPFPDSTWPVTTPVALGSLNLKVDFSDGSTVLFGPSYFTPNPSDPTSWDGGAIGIGGTNPQPRDATLTGTFTPTTITENDGSVHTIDGTFTAMIVSSGPGLDLNDQDFAIIYASDAGGAVPEPAFVSWMLLGTFFIGLVVVRNRHMFGKFRTMLSVRRGLQIALFLACVLALQSQSWAAVTLNAGTSPGSGVSGSTQVNATGSGFPSGPFTPSNVIVTLQTGVCGGPTAATTPAISITHILGTSYRVHFLIPSGLVTGNYFVSVRDSADATPFTSANCSLLQVTGVTSGLNACVPTSSLGVNAPVSPGPVTAYLPNGSWDASGVTGIKVVQVETGGGPVVAPASIATAGAVNSCAANPVTGQVVCTEDSNAVDLITGSTLTTTLFSSSNVTTGFSGGSCENCGVAIDALNNRAAIAMGFTPAVSGTAVQFLDLSTNTFAPPIPLANHVSEDILLDPTRALLLSPNESSIYDLLQTTKAGGGSEFGMSISSPFLTLDSAAEDCATGIAMSVGEFSSTVVLSDLTQATYVPGAPGSWSAPTSETPLSVATFSAGASGVSVAQGSSHLAVVTGEFGGSSYAVVLLPSTSGSGTPAIVDYAFVPMITCPAPACPSGAFSAGLDPHTVTAYTSGNNGKAYALLASYSGFFVPPSTLGQIDMACVLTLPRLGDGHTVADGDAHTCTTLIGPF
jgi:hypothetical protein